MLLEILLNGDRGGAEFTGDLGNGHAAFNVEPREKLSVVVVACGWCHGAKREDSIGGGALRSAHVGAQGGGDKKWDREPTGGVGTQPPPHPIPGIRSSALLPGTTLSDGDTPIDRTRGTSRMGMPSLGLEPRTR